MDFVRYPPPDIRHFRPSPFSQITPPPSQQKERIRYNASPSVDYINLRKHLESQKPSSRINLNDNYIRDEGCKILGDFLAINPEISHLELKGNNITSKGLVFILEGLQQNFKIKSMNLEWNYLGMEPSGLELLVNFLKKNQSLQHLDLKNNKISGNDAGRVLGELLTSSKSLLVLDLRWNEIGTLGAKSILAGLKENSSLKVLELAGNNVSEDILQEISSILEKNRQSNPIASQIKYEDSLNLRGNDPNQLVNETQIDMVKKLERELQEERKNKMEFQGKVEQEIQKFKAQEFELNKIIHDLELKNEKFLADNRLLRQNCEKLEIELDRLRSHESEIVKLHEFKLISLEKEAQEAEKRHKCIVDRLTEEHELQIKQVMSDCDERLVVLEDRVQELQSVKQDLEGELKKAIETAAKLKIEEEERMRELQYKLKEQENLKYASHLKNLEGRMKVLEEGREKINKKSKDLMREIKEAEGHRLNNNNTLQQELNEYKAEKERLEEKNKENENIVEKFRSELEMKENLIEKLEHEVNDLNEMIEGFKHDNKEHFHKLTAEHEEEIKNIQNDKEKLHAKMYEMQNALRQCTSENMRLRHDYQRLADILQSALNKSVVETFSENHFI